MRKTAFYDLNLEHGAQMREMFGYYLPWEYGTGHFKEHIGTREAVSVCDLDYMGAFSIDGAGAQKFIDRIFTRDLSGLVVGALRYTAMCNEDGNMMDDGTVWRLGEQSYRFISGDEGDFEWLQKQSAGFDVRLKNITSELTTLAIQGPRSQELISRLTKTNLGAIRYYHFTQGEVAGVDCIIARMGYTGEFGYELHFNPQFARQVWTALFKTGADLGVVPCGQAALESLRQEAGYLLVGNDHDKQTNPLEAGIGWTVHFEKEFNGKSALRRIADEGVKRKLVWLQLRSGEVPEKGDAIYSNGRKVGTVSSGSYSPTAKAGTAMGYVDPPHVIQGIEFEIESGGKRCKARMSAQPLYDPGDTKSKARK